MINVIIPMAGRGSRFDGSAHTGPKPFIEVIPGVRMVEMVIRYIKPSERHRFIFICQEEHVFDLKLHDHFTQKNLDFEIVATDQITDGPACSVLLAKKFIDNQEELLVAYCDDCLDIDIDVFLKSTRGQDADGSLLLFPSKDPGNSYAVIDASGRVLRTAEKELISPYATAALYYFKEGREFVHGAQRMIQSDKRANANNEFYVCPVYNELIQNQKSVISFKIASENVFQLGTPKELDMFISSYA